MRLDSIINTTVMNVTRLLDTTNELISNITGQVLNGFLNNVSGNVLCEGWLQVLLIRLLCTGSDFLSLFSPLSLSEGQFIGPLDTLMNTLLIWNLQ